MRGETITKERTRMAKNKILAIDDDPNMLDLTRYHLSAQGYVT